MSAQAYEYHYKVKGINKVSAEVAGAVCQQLHETKEGLTPQGLVDVSRPVDAPMHNEFEWDDSIAGEKYRVEQAKHVIRNLVIVKSDINKEREVKLDVQPEIPEEEVQDRAFQSTYERKNLYVPLMDALTNETWRANLLEAAKRDTRCFIAKYRRLDELAKIIDDMNDFLGA